MDWEIYGVVRTWKMNGQGRHSQGAISLGLGLAVVFVELLLGLNPASWF